MRQIFVFILVISSVQFVFSQSRIVLNTPDYDRKPYHLGFTIGFNAMDFNILHSEELISLNNFGNYTLDSVYSVECRKQAGFNIGIVTNLRLGRYFDLRFLPSISFGQRDLEYLIRHERSFKKKVMILESTFLEFPILFKYKSKRVFNYRPYLLAGGAYRLDLAAQKEIKESEKPKLRLESGDFYFEFGFGVDYYFYFFKFSTEIKYAVGLRNIVVPDETQYYHALEKLNSHLLIISFHFE